MQLNNTFYYPYVGNNYELGFKGIKLLILGESHYCGEGCDICGIKSGLDCSNFTNGVMDSFIRFKKGEVSHESWMTTFTRFTNVIFGEPVNNLDLIEFWNSVIFYNYVQSSTMGARISPSTQQFEESQESFFDIISKYQPDLIIVWGKRLWENLPDKGEWGDELILDGKYGKMYYYKVNNKRVPLFCVCHPSTSYFSYNYTRYFDEVFRIINLRNYTYN